MLLKYRAWINDGEHSRMVKSDQAVMTAIKNCYGGYGVVEGTTGYHYVDTATRPEKYILMQSTGLVDKNGVEVFEGDICLFYGRFGKEMGEIVFERYGFHIILESDFMFRIDEFQLEVLGNIYENAGLLVR